MMHSPETREKIRRAMKARWDQRTIEEREGIRERQAHAQKLRFAFWRGFGDERVGCQKCAYWFALEDGKNSKYEGECVRYPRHVITPFDQICGEFFEVIIPHGERPDRTIVDPVISSETAIGIGG